MAQQNQPVIVGSRGSADNHKATKQHHRCKKKTPQNSRGTFLLKLLMMDLPSRFFFFVEVAEETLFPP